MQTLDRRLQAAMWAAAAALCAIGTLLAHPGGTRLAGFAALTAVATVIAVALHLSKSRSPPTLQVANAAASVAACAAIGLNSDPTTATQTVLLWPALYAAYFFSGRAVIVQLLIVAVGFSTVTVIAGWQGSALLRIWNTIGAVAGAAAVVWLMRQRLEATLLGLRTAATTDALTSLLNRRGFDAILEAELTCGSAAEEPLTLVVGDLDHFKQVNDGFGHDVGDRVLTRIAATLERGVREGDVVARIGGEEFGIVLPRTAAPAAQEMVERLRVAIAETPDQEAGHLSMSFGIAEYPSMSQDRLGLLRSADQALYAAKAAGRDRILTA